MSGSSRWPVTANPPASELLTIEEPGSTADREKALVEPPPSRRSSCREARCGRRRRRSCSARSGRKAFEDLIAEHPPTDDDHDEVRRMTGRPEALARWHPTRSPGVARRVCVDPKLSPRQAGIYEDWTDAEIGELFGAAMTVCQGARQVDLGKASRAARTSAANHDRRPQYGSPGRSSSAGRCRPG
jgi:hypothetical protein